MQGLRQEQAALQQGLEQLGRNLSQAADQTGSMSRDVGAALGRANLSMQQTAQALEQMQQGQGQMPTQQAAETVEALNRLALSLLNSQQEGGQQQNAGGSVEQAMEQLAQIAQQQGQLNGRSNSLMPLNLQPRAMAQQMNRMAQEQRDIATKLDGVNESVGRRDDVLGDLNAMAQEAERLARELEGGRLPADVLARQERLFHRLLDAGRTLEKDETSEERKAERPGDYTPSVPPALDASLLDTSVRYRVPTPEELKSLPPAYRKMILEYFERINRVSPGAEGRRRE
jgi:chromosome segregation ATPase